MLSAIQKLKQKILNFPQIITSDVLIKISPILSFTISLLILYYLEPSSFEATWKGRTYYLFFTWLIFLELILDWEEIQVKIHKLKSPRFIAFDILLLLPTVYVIVANFSGLNTAIINISPKHYGTPNPMFWAEWMPLSVEYLVFAVLFALIILVAYGTKGLKDFSLPLCMVGIIGSVYVIDNLYPFGEFAPFQILVPTTAVLAASVLNLMGYQTEWIGQSAGTPVLRVWSSKARFQPEAGISWSCSGIDSLILYSVTILLFLKNSGISWRQRTIYLMIGAIITYFINILRIVTIFRIGTDYGVGSLQWEQFHNYYGALYSIMWIVAYPLIIIGTRILWGKIRKREDKKVQL